MPAYARAYQQQQSKTPRLLAVLAGSAAIIAAGTVALQTSARMANVALHSAPRHATADVVSCSRRPWPYYDNECLRTYTGEARAVRVIPLDRAGMAHGAHDQAARSARR